MSRPRRTRSSMIERVRSKPLRFRDERITMAHGAGGKATQALVEGLLAPAFGMTELARRGAPSTGSRSRPTASSSSRSASPAARSASSPSTAPSTTSRSRGARPLALTLSLVLEEGLARRRAARRGRARSRAPPPRPRASQIVAGDTKVVERGRCDSMYICTTGLGRVDPRAQRSPRRRCGRATASSSRGRSASTARRSCSPAASSSSRAGIESDTRSLWPAVDALLDAAGPSLRCIRDATRGGVASVLNELARASGVAVVVREAAVPVHPAVARRLRDPRHRPDVRRERGPARRLRRARGGRATRSPRSRAVPGCGEAAEIGEVKTDPPGLVLVETRVRRAPGHGHARGRPAPAHLLKGAPMTAVEFVPNQNATEAVTAHVIWMTSGLSCDGDSVAMTSATNPSLEDIVRGIIPGMPRVVVHNPVLAYENGADFMKAWWQAEAGELDPFVLVVRGLDPERGDQRRRPLDGHGHRPVDRPADHDQRVDRPAGAEGRGGRRRRHVRHVRRHPGDEEQPDRARWASPTTSAGTGSRRPGSRSSASRAARRSPTT